MLVRPVYNILLLPDVSYYFKKEFFTGFGEEELTPGSDILFIFLKNENEQEEYTEEDFYPIGLSARVDAVSEEDTISVRTLERVEVTDLEPVNGVLAAAASIRPEVTDLTDEEAGQKFGQIRGSLLRFVQGYQWGLWARSFILQRKNMYDLACSLSDYLNLNAEEKYHILSVDSRRERYDRIINAITEFMEIAKVSEEAQSAQKDDQEQLYREAAIKKQIDYLQRETGRDASGKCL